MNEQNKKTQAYLIEQMKINEMEAELEIERRLDEEERRQNKLADETEEARQEGV